MEESEWPWDFQSCRKDQSALFFATCQQRPGARMGADCGSWNFKLPMIIGYPLRADNRVFWKLACAGPGTSFKSIPPSKAGQFRLKPSASINLKPHMKKSPSFADPRRRPGPDQCVLPELEQAIREEAKRLLTILEQAGAS